MDSVIWLPLVVRKITLFSKQILYCTVLYCIPSMVPRSSFEDTVNLILFVFQGNFSHRKY